MLGLFATASRRMPLFYIAIHQVSLLSHAACAIAIASAGLTMAQVAHLRQGL